MLLVSKNKHKKRFVYPIKIYKNHLMYIHEWMGQIKIKWMNQRTDFSHCALSRHPHILALHAVFRLPTHQWVLVMDCRNLIGGSVIAFWVTLLVQCELV